MRICAWSQCRVAFGAEMALLRTGSCTWQFSEAMKIILIAAVVPNNSTINVQKDVNRKVICACDIN